MRRNAYCSLPSLAVLPLLTGLVMADSQTDGAPSATAYLESPQGELPVQPAPYEPPPVLNAADLLPGEALSGPSHRVVDAVPSDGFLTRFTIESDFGAFEATSPALALTRIREISTLAALERFETEDLAKDGFEHSANRLKESFQNLAEDRQGWTLIRTQTTPCWPSGLTRWPGPHSPEGSG